MPNTTQLGTHIQILEVLAVVIARRSGEPQEIGELFEQLATIVLRSKEEAFDLAWGEQCVRRIAQFLAAGDSAQMPAPTSG